jgi:class 3 adenylate cyclase
MGHVHHDRVRGQLAQRFLRPGEATLEPDGVLPRATHYLVHPVLSDVIGRMNPAYLERIDRVNIVGYGRPWHETESAAASATSVRPYCVLKADVYGFGNLMLAGVDAPVRQALEDAVSRWAGAGAIAETGGGDSLLIAADDPAALAVAARHIMDEVYQAPGQPRLRMALHYGDVQTRQRDGDEPPVIAGGNAILCAARVEPHVEPGQIWATEEFRQQLFSRPSLWRTTAISASDGGDRFNVKKEEGEEPDLWVRLYRLEF